LFRKILFLLFVTISTLYFNACTDDPSSIGSALLNQDIINLDSLDSYKDTLTQTSSSHIFVIPLGYSDMLLVGKNGSTEAYTLLSFYLGMPDSIKNYFLSGSLSVLEAKVELVVNYKVGSTAGFSFTANQINNTWSTGFTSDSLAALTTSGTNSASSITLSNDSVLTFNLDTALVHSWLTAEADPNIIADNGIILKPVSTGGIIGFNSVTSSTSNSIPLMRVVVNKAGWSGVDTLSFIPAIDVGAVKGSIPTGNTENIYVQSGVTINSVLKFSLNKIPEHAIINYAELELFTDTTANIVGSSYSNSIGAYIITDSTKQDSASSSITLTRSGDYFKGNIAYFIQNWISTKNNNGLLLKTGAPLDGVELFTLKGSNASDPLKRPRLKITFTNKK